MFTRNLVELIRDGWPTSAVAEAPAVGTAPEGVDLNPIPVAVHSGTMLGDFPRAQH